MQKQAGHNYASLSAVFQAALGQASQQKGKERHANDQPFEKQPICVTTRNHGIGFPLGQAEKKIQEQYRLPTAEKRIHELLGAINYIAAAIIVLQELE